MKFRPLLVVLLLFATVVLNRPSYATGLSAAEIKCTMNKGPQVNITPISAPIQYDRTHTVQSLTTMGSNTVNPYGASVPIMQYGLMSNSRLVELEVQFGGSTYPQHGVTCLWYGVVDVTIRLMPVIYLAQDIQGDRCNKEIKKHEHKHEEVGRLVVNKYAYLIGTEVKSAVQNAGPMGPYNNADLQRVQNMMLDHIKSVVSSQELAMHKELKGLNGKIDSKEEYIRISKICENESHD